MRQSFLFILSSFFFIHSNAQSELGWNDICSGNNCYIWQGNPPPFNDISEVVHSPFMIDGTTIWLNPYLGTCDSFATCSNLNNPLTTEKARFQILETTFITDNNVAIRGLANQKTALNVILSDACTAFHVQAENVSLLDLSFTVGAACQATAPILVASDLLTEKDDLLYNTFFFSNLASTSSYATILVLNTFATFTFQQLTSASPYAVVLFQVDGSMTCANLNANLFLAGTATSATCENNLINVSHSFEGVALPLYECAEPEIVEETNCDKNAATLFILILSSILLVLLILLIFTCRGLHLAAHGLGEHTVEETDTQQSLVN
jgi:hypothetical protein